MTGGPTTGGPTTGGLKPKVAGRVQFPDLQEISDSDNDVPSCQVVWKLVDEIIRETPFLCDGSAINGFVRGGSC